jgi:hypothetical protein
MKQKHEKDLRENAKGAKARNPNIQKNGIGKHRPFSSVRFALSLLSRFRAKDFFALSLLSRSPGARRA